MELSVLLVVNFGSVATTVVVATVLTALVAACSRQKGPASQGNGSGTKLPSGTPGGTPVLGSAGAVPAAGNKSQKSATKPATPGSNKDVAKNDKSKKSAEKPNNQDTPKDENNNTKEKEEDSFEQHKPVPREAKRADEIKKHGPVDQKRKDYKTIRLDVPSSDFDKSLGLPNVDDNKPEPK